MLLWRLLGSIAGIVLAVVLSTTGIILTETFPHTEDWGSGWLFIVTWFHAIPIGAVAGFQVVRHWQLLYRQRAVMIALGSSLLLTFLHKVIFLYMRVFG